MIRDIKNVNSNSDRHLVAFYAPNTGGKFVLNCLALSSGVVFQDHKLAHQQLNGELTVNHKLDLLLYRLTCTGSEWADLGLGCTQLFGDTSYKFSNVKEFSLKHCAFHSAIYRLSYSNLYYASVAHEVRELENIMRYWPRSQIIHFCDHAEFTKKFRPNQLALGWQQVKGHHWPTVPSTLDEYFALPHYVKQELQTRQLEDFFMSVLMWKADIDCLNRSYQAATERIFKHHLAYTWHVDCVLNQDYFLHEIKQLYQQLQLDDFCADRLLQFRDAYLNKLSAILTV